MQKSSKSRRSDKPTKPYDGYPLFPHASGRWAKKIKGRFHYFGRWGNKQGGKVVPVDDVSESAQQAVDLFNEQRDDLFAGRTPRKTAGGLTVADLANQFLNAKRVLLETKEIQPRTFQEYYNACGKLVDGYGKSRLVNDLAADDFSRLRSKLAKGRGPVSLAKDIRLTRMIFKYGLDAGLIENPVRYGQNFNAPSKRVIRQARSGNGKRMFEANELRSILDTISHPMRAMVLLGINCGFGQSDIANLPQSAVDIEKGWIDFPRPKTGIERRCPLWLETLAALQEAIEKRPEPNDPNDDGLVFVTRRGNRWVRATDSEKRAWNDSVGLEFGKLLKKLDLKRPGLNFYALRHTFQTIAEESRDLPAIKHVMGHADDSMSAVYRERISDERLRAVTDTVHNWLWPKVAETE